jgi:hypothetical protein
VTNNRLASPPGAADRNRVRDAAPPEVLEVGNNGGTSTAIVDSPF